MSIRRGSRRLAGVILLVFLMGSAFIAAALQSAPLSPGGSRDGMIKVRLDSLGQFNRLDITTQGSYSLLGAVELSIPSGSRLTFQMQAHDGMIVLTYSGQSYVMGPAFRLRRHQGADAAGFRLAQGRVPGNLYPADLYVFGNTTESGTRFTAVANVFLEDYLYGVLPYEMGDSAHPEALKAQAVAARTYAMARMGRGTIDVVDTTQDQVYAGTPSGNPRARTAVDATRGIVIQNNGVLTATYYTASNGGQTESIRNIWNTASYPYLDVKDDPYDLANPASRVKSAEFSFDPLEMDPNLLAILEAKARSVTGDGQARVERVLWLLPHSPQYPSPSRLYTKLDVGLNLILGGRVITRRVTFDIFNELEGPLGLSINSQKNELFSVSRTESGFLLSARRYGHGLGMSQRGAMHMGSMGYTYDQILAFYYPGCVRVGYSLTRSVLSAYVPGLPSTPLPTQETPAPIGDPDPQLGQVIHGAVLYQEALSASPVLLHLKEGDRVQVLAAQGEYYGVRFGRLEGYVQKSRLVFSGTVPGQAVQSSRLMGYGTIVGAASVNLRAGPSLSHQVLLTLPRGVLLPLFGKEGNFYQVQYGTRQGYVSADYLNRMDSHPYQALAAGPEEALVRGKAVPFRSQPDPGASLLATLTDQDPVILLRMDGSWAYVQWGERFGYLLSQSLEFTRPGAAPSVSPSPSPGAAPTDKPAAQPVLAWVTTPSGSLNFRESPSANARILMTIRPGSQVEVQDRGQQWCKIRAFDQDGYVMTQFLRFAAGEPESPDPQPTPAPNPVKPGMSAWVSTSSGSLNLRSQPQAEGAIIARIPNRDRVLVLDTLTGWTKVAHDGKTGYVVSAFLRFDQPEAAGIPAVPASVASADQQTPQATMAPDACRDSSLQKLAQPKDAQVKPGTSMVYLLKGCHEDSTRLTRMLFGDSLLVVEEGRDWCRVIYEGKEGYCPRDTLEIAEW